MSKTVPPGGVPVVIDVPSAWQRRDLSDGACQFVRAGLERLTVALEFCPSSPCDTKLAGGRTRETSDLTLSKQTMRTTTVRIGDPVTHYVVSCSANVQGATITPAMDDELRRLAAPCDTLAVASAP